MNKRKHVCAKGVVMKNIVRLYTRQRHALAFLAMVFLSCKVYADEDSKDLSSLLEMSFDNLVDVEISTASSYTQKLKDVPSSASVVTAEDIKTYGYQTLSDVLATMPSILITNDRNYDYISVRGFSRLGDYNTRILLLVDGIRVNDNIFNQGYIGEEAIVDIHMIERVEFIPSSGASLYGDNAFFGVINVITKQAKDINGLETTAEAGSYQRFKGSMRYGQTFENGASLVLSASSLDSHGQDWRYREFAGKAKDLDGERSKKLSAKLSIDDFKLTLHVMDRSKQNPTAAYNTVFGDKRFETEDQQIFFNATQQISLGDKQQLRLRYDYAHFEYDAVFPYENLLNIDETKGSRHSADVRYTSEMWQNHKLVAGIEYVHDSQLVIENYDKSPFTQYVQQNNTNDKYGIYLQDELSLSNTWLLNAGLRYDHYEVSDATFSPRLALIYQPSAQDNLKLIYSRAYRAPNPYELYYGAPASTFAQKGNTQLGNEEVNAYEAIWDHTFNASWNSHLSLFSNKAKGVISQISDPNDNQLVFQNNLNVSIRGIETGLEGAWQNGLRLKGSFTLQDAHEEKTGEHLTNSPTMMSKLQLSGPLVYGWQFGSDIQYVGQRKTKAGGTGSYTKVNSNIYRNNILPKLDIALGVYNLFDKKYADPADIVNVQDTLERDGRMFRLRMDYRF